MTAEYQWRPATWLIVLALCQACGPIPPSGSQDSAQCPSPSPGVWLHQPNPARGFAPLRVSLRGDVTRGAEWRLEPGNGATLTGRDSVIERSFTYVEPGTYAPRLSTVPTACDHEVTASVTVEVLAPVELVATEVHGQPGAVQPGDPIDMSVRVTNDSDANLSVPFTVRFALSDRSRFSWEEIDALPTLAVTTVPHLDGRGFADVHVEARVPRVRGGTYWLVAAVDLPDRIREQQEFTNNLALSSPIVIRYPDRDAKNLHADGVEVEVGTICGAQVSELRVRANLHHRGLDPVRTRYAVWAQEGPGEFDRDLAVRVFRSSPVDLSAGADSVLSVDTGRISLARDDVPQPGSGGILGVFVCVDPDNAVNERVDGVSTEGDNCARPPIPVRIPDLGPGTGLDIVAIDLVLEPESIALGDSITVRPRLANYGDRPSLSTFCSIHLSADEVLAVQGDLHLTNVNVSRLTPERDFTRATLAAVPRFFPAGEYRPYMLCDPTNTTHESCEHNNTAVASQTVTLLPEPTFDLAVTELSLAERAEDGADLVVVANVANLGNTASGAARLEILQSDDPESDVGDRILGAAVVPALDAGEGSEVAVTVQSRCPIFTGGAVRIVARVAGGDTRPDNDALSSRLSLTGPRCRCTPTVDLPELPGHYTGLSLCEPGHLSFPIDMGINQSLHVTYDPELREECTNLDIALRDDNFQRLAEAVGDNPREQFLVPLVAQGRYILDVFSATDCDVNRFDLNVRLLELADGIDLVPTAIRSDTDTMVPGGPLRVHWSAANLGREDAGPHTTNVSLRPVQDGPIADLGDATSPGVPATRVARLEYSGLAPLDLPDGDYQVCVETDSDDVIPESDERNNLACGSQLMTMDRSCHDALEYNDAFEQATPVEAGRYGELVLCADRPRDFFMVCGQEGQRLELKAEFGGDDDDAIQLCLQDLEGDVLACAPGQGGVASLSLPYLQQARCLVASTALNGPPRLDYTFVLTLAHGDIMHRCTDPLEDEPEPDLLDAAGPDVGLDLCPMGDTDTYFWELNQDQAATLCAGPADNVHPRSLNITVYDPQRRQVTSATGPEPCVEWTAQTPGQYQLRVLSPEEGYRYPYALSASAN